MSDEHEKRAREWMAEQGYVVSTDKTTVHPTDNDEDLIPLLAAELRAAKAEGVREERARVVAWLRGKKKVWGPGGSDAFGDAADDIDGGDHAEHVASAPAAGAEVCPACQGLPNVGNNWPPCSMCGGTGRRST